RGERVPQLTLRAVLMGAVIGMAMSLSNLYTTIKLGWAFGVAITACIISYVVWNAIRAASGHRLSKMTILENNCMQSTASAAGYSTGGTIGTAFGALLLIQGEHFEWYWLAPFVLLTAALGVFIAVPMKRQMINHEQLRFPSGIAAAETLRSLYSHGREAAQKANALIFALFGGMLLAFYRTYPAVFEALHDAGRVSAETVEKVSKWPMRVPELLDWNSSWLVSKYQDVHVRTWGFEPSMLLVAAGMIVGMRVSLSMLLGSIVLFFVVTPAILDADIETLRAHPEYVTAIRQSGDEYGINTTYVTSVKELGKEIRKGFDVETMKYMDRATWEKKLLEAGVDPAKIVPEKSGEQAADVLGAPAGGEKADGGEGAGNDGEQADQKAQAGHIEEWKHVGNPERAFAFYPVNWALWGGTSVMVFSSLTAVAMGWRTLVRAFKGGAGPAEGATADDLTEMAKIEVPFAWFVLGMVPITIGLIILMMFAFEMSWWLGLISVVMTYPIALVCCRATGETDTTPIGAMGKVTQLVYAVLAKGQIVPNLMAAGTTAAAGGASADLLTDLKSGYLLGANPRKQFLAQFFGIFFGTLIIVPAWYLMVRNAEAFDAMNPPAAKMWQAVALALTQGLHSIPKSAQMAIVIGGLVGIALPLIQAFLPAKHRKWVPSAMGIGLAWVVPWYNALGFAIGAVIAWIWHLMHKKSADKFTIPIASGIVAGEALMAAMVAITATLIGLLFASGAAGH
ncbi:MAG TPA: OPT family oligopeptide transporter, partial [Phycisphaerales bacterium]|nr:OPT family oligopeptide transporter [Phycisphaerales bacterium]